MQSTSSLITKVQLVLDRLITALEPTDFINCHMVTYLCDNLWNKFIPEDIRNEIQNQDDVTTALEVFFHQEHIQQPELIQKHQNLFNHIQHAKSFYLENLKDKLYLTTDELLEKFKMMHIPIEAGLNINIREFMKEKKNHEVEIAARIVASLAKAHSKQHIVVDVGDGKGYLSSRLALEYKLKVLGIDGNPRNSKEAGIRNQRLSKMWKTLVTKKAQKLNVELPTNDDIAPSPEIYKTTSKMIFGDTDLSQLVQEKFHDDSTKDLCLVGLHTCGNLASNSLKQFVQNDNIRSVCNVGCCYHLIFEEFSPDFFNAEMRELDYTGDFGFPLSKYLRDKNYKLGRNARMLAAQCYERVLHKREMPDKSLFYRALFEKVLRERWKRDPGVIRVGKIKFNSFEEYLRKACKKFDINMDLSADDIQKLLNEHELDSHLINLNYFIRLLQAKKIESLILLDRYLFLMENNFDKVYLVKIFEAVVSPRNFALIAIKD